MKVLPIQQQTYYYYHNNSSKKEIQNPSFKGGLTAAGAYKLLVYFNIANRTKRSFNSSKKIYQVKKNIVTLMKDLSVDKAAKAELITCLSLIPAHIDESGRYGLYTLFHRDTESIEVLKIKALNEILPSMDDNYGPDINAKKEFILSLFNKGEYMNDDFIKAFESLPEKYYKDFKEEIADRMLYRLDKYRPTDEPEQYIYNLRLINTLGNDNHKEYLIKNTQGIKQTYNKIIALALKELTSEPNQAYMYYSYNCKNGEYIFLRNMKLWEKYYEIAFNNALLRANGDYDKLAEILKIDRPLAEDITKDIFALHDAEEASSPEEKLEIYKQRINEKIALQLPYENDNKHVYEQHRILHAKFSGIKNFIDKTEMPKELTDIYRADIDAIYDRYRNAYYEYHKNDSYEPYQWW